MTFLRQFLARWLSSPMQGMRLGDYARVLRENGYAVDPPYWPRALSTGVAALLNSWQARREQRRFGSRVAATRVERPVFVLGHYRSGTTHLHNLLAQDERLGFPNYYEVTFPHTFLSTEGGLGTRLGNLFAVRKRPQDDVAIDLWATAEDEVALSTMTGLSPHMMWHFPRHATRYRPYLSFEEATAEERRQWCRALELLARKLTVRHHGKVLVFKSPCHTARIALILEVFPDARFVHIHRDPFEIFQSTRNTELRVAPFFQFQRTDHAGLDEMILWRYRAMVDAFLAQRPQIPAGCLIETSYGDLLENPLRTLRNLYDTLDLPDFERARPAVERYLREVRDYRRNRYDSLDPELRRRITSEWAAAFDAWRYPTTPGRLHA